MPTATDEKLAADLAAFRIEAAGKFSAIETELAIIRKLGTWLLGGVFGLVAALITGAATVGWSASSVNSDVRHLGERVDKIEKRLDGIDQKLDILVNRVSPKT